MSRPRLPLANKGQIFAKRRQPEGTLYVCPRCGRELVVYLPALSVHCSCGRRMVAAKEGQA